MVVLNGIYFDKFEVVALAIFIFVVIVLFLVISSKSKKIRGLEDDLIRSEKLYKNELKRIKEEFQTQLRKKDLEMDALQNERNNYKAQRDFLLESRNRECNILLLLREYDMLTDLKPIEYMLLNGILFVFKDSSHPEILKDSVEKAIMELSYIPVQKRLIPIYKMVIRTYELLPEEERGLNWNIQIVKTMLESAEGFYE